MGSASRRVAALGACSLALLLVGCASEGPLRPPSLNLPGPVQRLVANRVGDAVDLRWTDPTRTTDGQALARRHHTGALHAEICRINAPGAACVAVGVAPVLDGDTETCHDVLPGPLAAGPPRVVRYRVRMLNDQGKGGDATAVETLAGAAPQRMEGVSAEPSGEGVLLRWRPVAEPAAGRVQLRVDRGDAPAASLSPGGRKDSAVHSPAAPGGILLDLPLNAADAGGALDTGARQGVAQHYLLARTRTVPVPGKLLTMSSVPVAVSVLADAKAPPLPAPRGLETIASTLGVAEIDLVWQPVAAAVGYRVLRGEEAGPLLLLTPEPVSGQTYSDRTVRPGIRYRYSVAAVDRFGVTGPAGAQATEQVPGP